MEISPAASGGREDNSLHHSRFFCRSAHESCFPMPNGAGGLNSNQLLAGCAEIYNIEAVGQGISAPARTPPRFADFPPAVEGGVQCQMSCMVPPLQLEVFAIRDAVRREMVHR